MSFLQGFWYDLWASIQRWHTSQIGIEFDSNVWSSKAIFLILQYVYDCRNMRNRKLHITGNLHEKQNKLHNEVRLLYSDPDRYLFLTQEKQRSFNTTLERKLCCSNAKLESWIDLVKTRLRLDRQEHAKQISTGWLDDNKGCPNK